MAHSCSVVVAFALVVVAGGLLILSSLENYKVQFCVKIRVSFARQEKSFFRPLYSLSAFFVFFLFFICFFCFFIFMLLLV